MSNDHIAVAAFVILAASAYKALRGSNISALTKKYTGIESPPNISAAGYDQKPPAPTANRPGPLPIALEGSGLPLTNPLVDLVPTALARGGNYSSLIRNTNQNFDPRGPLPEERAARLGSNQYPLPFLINERMEEAIKDSRELSQFQDFDSRSAFVPL
jgi:hypothetical protein